MVKPSVEQLMPEWMKQKDYQVLPSVDTVAFNDLSLAVTIDGLQTYPDAFNSLEAFLNHARDVFANASFLRRSRYLRVPVSHPEMLIKVDVTDEPISTLLTLAYLARQIPLETDDYVFRPIRLFWAASFNGPISLIAMENAEVHPVLAQTTHRFMIKGINRIDEEARRVNLGTSRDPQDFLYRGNDPLGRPILTIIDQINPNIFNLFVSI